MSDSSDLDTAVITLLQNDAQLKALLPDGVYMDEAPPGSTRFTLVGVQDSQDSGAFGGRAIEEVTYFVKAVSLSTLGVNMKAAAARIDDLLSDPAAGLTVTGYTYMTVFRNEDTPRIRFIEVDQIDASLRWLHRGGHYTLQCSRQ